MNLCRIVYIKRQERSLRHNPPCHGFDLEFRWIITSGAETCRFRIWKKKDGEKEDGGWEKYSKILEERALKRWKAKREQK